MNIEDFLAYCSLKHGTSSDFPFDASTLCFRVKGRIFALTDLEAVPFKVNLKCDPDYAQELREAYEGVQPGYHMNKQHWNTVNFESDVPEGVLRQLVDHSYLAVARKLPKADRFELGI
jgi:predicted DNA-binding protein (MmcQ/YjbR family)